MHVIYLQTTRVIMSEELVQQNKVCQVSRKLTDPGVSRRGS